MTRKLTEVNLVHSERQGTGKKQNRNKGEAKLPLLKQRQVSNELSPWIHLLPEASQGQAQISGQSTLTGKFLITVELF